MTIINVVKVVLINYGLINNGITIYIIFMNIINVVKVLGNMLFFLVLISFELINGIIIYIIFMTIIYVV